MIDFSWQRKKSVEISCACHDRTRLSTSDCVYCSCTEIITSHYFSLSWIVRLWWVNYFTNIHPSQKWKYNYLRIFGIVGDAEWRSESGNLDYLLICEVTLDDRCHHKVKSCITKYKQHKNRRERLLLRCAEPPFWIDLEIAGNWETKAAELKSYSSMEDVCFCDFDVFSWITSPHWRGPVSYQRV